MRDAVGIRGVDQLCTRCRAYGAHHCACFQVLLPMPLPPAVCVVSVSRSCGGGVAAAGADARPGQPPASRPPGSHAAGKHGPAGGGRGELGTLSEQWTLVVGVFLSAAWQGGMCLSYHNQLAWAMVMCSVGHLASRVLLQAGTHLCRRSLRGTGWSSACVLESHHLSASSGSSSMVAWCLWHAYNSAVAYAARLTLPEGMVLLHDTSHAHVLRLLLLQKQLLLLLLCLAPKVLRAAESGQLRLLYVAPEKLGASHILSCLQRLPNLPLVCIDEAHCMAEWGEGFRPAYFRCVFRVMMATHWLTAGARFT